MEDLRCKRPECPKCRRLGRLLARICYPPSVPRPVGIVLELICPYDKKRKLLFKV